MKTSNLIWSLVLCTSLGAAKPNIVFFLVDDLGYMDVGAYNPDCFYETPHIDKLAASGMKFTHGYAANPVCSLPATVFRRVSGPLALTLLISSPVGVAVSLIRRPFMTICHFLKSQSLKP